jgi:hypothetical protein
MSDDEFEHVTTDAFVEIYESSSPIFEAIFREVRGLSKKKPEATMSASKVKVINRVLTDLLIILKGEPAGKYLDLLSDEALPQVSDAVLAMVQFETALEAFESRYRKYIQSQHYWITAELLEQWKKDEVEDGDEDDEDEDEDDEGEDDEDEDEDEDDEEDSGEAEKDSEK